MVHEAVERVGNDLIRDIATNDIYQMTSLPIAILVVYVYRIAFLVPCFRSFLSGALYRAPELCQFFVVITPTLTLPLANCVAGASYSGRVCIAHISFVWFFQ